MRINNWLSFDGTVAIELNWKELQEFTSDLHSYDGLIELNEVMHKVLEQCLRIVKDYQVISDVKENR